MIKKHSKTSGFTLVETLIYAALLSVIIGMMVVVAFQVIDGNSNLGEKTEISLEGKRAYRL